MKTATKCLLLVPLLLLIFSLAAQPPVQVYTGPVEFDGNRAYGLLKVLASNYRGRVVGSRACRKSAEWIAKYFESLGLRTVIDEFDAPGFGGTLVTAYNVYAVKEGREDAYIVLIAHHDIVPRTIEGANDNGGGVAVLMELARVFAHRDTRLGIVFLSTDAEETGLHGAERFLEVFGGDIVAAISIDMCTWKDHEGVALYAFFYPPAAFSDLGILLLFAEAGKLDDTTSVHDIALSVLSARLLFIFAGTDSIPFAKRGVPAVGITDYPMYPYWHRAQDTIDKISPGSLQEVGVLVERVVMSIDKGYMLRLGDQYLFVGDRAFYGPFVYASWAALTLTAFLEVWERKRAGGSLRAAAKLFLVSEAIVAVSFAVAVLIAVYFTTILPVIIVGSAVLAIAFSLVSRNLFATVDSDTLKIAALLPSLAVYSLGLVNPTTALLLLATHAYVCVLAKPRGDGRLSYAVRVLTPMVSLLVPVALLAAACVVMSPAWIDRFIASMITYGLKREPVLVTLILALATLPATATALVTCLVARKEDH